MTREEVIKALAKEFGISPNEDGEYDLNDNEWQSGCYMNGHWLCLARIVYTVSK